MMIKGDMTVPVVSSFISTTVTGKLPVTVVKSDSCGSTVDSYGSKKCQLR